jgi:hypothetical protein
MRWVTRLAISKFGQPNKPVFYFILYLLYDSMIINVNSVIIVTMSILFPSGVRFLSRAAALTVSYHHNRGFTGSLFESEDSEDALVNTVQWFTRDNRSKASIPNANSC